MTESHGLLGSQGVRPEPNWMRGDWWWRLEGDPVTLVENSEDPSLCPNRDPAVDIVGKATTNRDPRQLQVYLRKNLPEGRGR